MHKQKSSGYQISLIASLACDWAHFIQLSGWRTIALQICQYCWQENPSKHKEKKKFHLSSAIHRSDRIYIGLLHACFMLYTIQTVEYIYCFTDLLENSCISTVIKRFSYFYYWQEWKMATKPKSNTIIKLWQYAEFDTAVYGSTAVLLLLLSKL